MEGRRMGISLSSAYSQAAKAGGAADSAESIAVKLNNLQATLNANWNADEMKIVNQAIDKMERDLRQQARLLQTLESDIQDVAREIQREEELERQRLAKLEQERKEREEKERQEKLNSIKI
jgi:uncharacterized protein YukE